MGYCLPRQVWLLQSGVLVNSLGLGFVFPFELIYLHAVRGFGLSTAGLIAATLTGVAVAGGIAAGPAIDRFGAPTTAVLALGTLSVGWAALGFVTRPWQGFACAIVAGLGNGCFIPSQSTLVMQIAPRELRHRATAVTRVAVNLGVGLGAALGGLVATTTEPATYTVLFLVNAASYLVYAAIILRLRLPRVGRGRTTPPGGYLRVMRHRPLAVLVASNVVFTCVGWGVLASLVPVYAHDHAGIGERAIGLVF